MKNSRPVRQSPRPMLWAVLPGAFFAAGTFLAEGESVPRLSAFIIPLLIIALLLFLNGLFVAGEFGFIGARTTRMEPLAEEGNATARAVLTDMHSTTRQDQYIATTQLAITLTSLGLGMYGEPAIAHLLEGYLPGLFHLFGRESVPDALLHTIGYILTLSFLTYLHVVIGEMIPKSLALAEPENVILKIHFLMSLARAIFLLPVRFLNGIGNYVLRILRIPPVEGHAQLYAPEEIEQLVSESVEGGLIEKEEELMLRNIFDFSERQVVQLMTPRRKVQAIPVSAKLEDVLSLVTQSKHSRFPVYEGDLDHIVGMIHLKDLVRQQLNPVPRAFDLRLLVKPMPAVPESYPVEHLLAAFRARRLHMAVIVDEYGGTAGIVTLEDLVEEIVGEIRDEFDYERDPIVFLEPGVVEVTGTYLVDDLREYLFPGEEEDLPDVKTVGGLIVSWLGRPPLINDTYTFNEIVYTVTGVDGLAISRARVQYPIPLGNMEKKG